ncbi:Aldo/keto reductase [Exidia glandulosa HHB12029]|uniref:Aldo/keto reductase n=1 Tax=Exidia glandulosa HHB12029 TaxID=1314781 RepID=A0A165MFP4_EXIGL|nr:Aldo/keto reductase [Exidia glandulosa HHB12029]
MAELALTSTAHMLSGHTIPRIGLGVFQNRDSCTPACLSAFKAGYRHVDSAQVYRNEDQVGEAIRKSGLDRKDLFITSKVVSRNQGYDLTITGVNESLERFGLDYLDLFLIHDPLGGKEKRLATWRALIKLRDEGKLKSIGVSNYGVHHLEEIKAEGLETPSVNQIEASAEFAPFRLHPWCQQRPIVEYCNKNGIIIEAYTPLAQAKPGYLTNPVVVAIAEKHGKDSAQVLIRWSLQTGHVVLPKSATESRIYSNANVYDFKLDEDDMGKLNALDAGDKGAVTWNPVNAP